MPVVVNFIIRIPIIGDFLSLPGIKQFVDRFADGSSMVWINIIIKYYYYYYFQENSSYIICNLIFQNIIKILIQ